MGLNIYHDRFGQIPPTYLADKKGNPIHSWRTMVLPFMEQKAMYAKYDFCEPWNGPKNSLLHASNLPYSQCPDDENAFVGETSYVAVCGEGGTWTGENLGKFSEFSHGKNNTILVIETQHSGIHWMDPRDFSVEQAIQELSSPNYTGHNGEDILFEGEGFFFNFESTGHNVLMADGSVRFIPIIAEETARSQLNGTHFGDQDIKALAKHRYRINYGNIGRLVIFVFLALLPSYWVVVRMRRERVERRELRVE